MPLSPPFLSLKAQICDDIDSSVTIVNPPFLSTKAQIRDDIDSGAAVATPDLLNRFLLLSFADIKVPLRSCWLRRFARKIRTHKVTVLLSLVPYL